MLRIGFGVAMTLVAATVSAGERWRHLEPQAQRAIEPEDFAVGADGSLWLTGTEGVRRVDANGTTTGSLAAAPQTGGYSRIKLTADQGAVFASNRCAVTRVDAAVRVRWTRQLPDDGCHIAPVGDAVWVASSFGVLYRLDEQGVIVRQIPLEASIPYIVAMPDGGVAVVASSGGPLQSTITRYSRDGHSLWTVTRSAYLSDAAVGADGALTAAGVTTRGIAVYRFDASGAPLSEFVPPNGSGATEGNVVVRLAPDGSASVTSRYYVTAATAEVVYRFDALGRFAWRREVCSQPSELYVPPESVLPLAGGGVAVACGRNDGARYLRFDASGAPVVDAPLPTLTAKLDLRADGKLQALGYAPTTNAMRLFVVDIDGRPSDVPAPTGPEPLDLVDEKFDDDGTTWLLSRTALRADPQRLSLAKIDAGGSVAWRRTFDVTSPYVRLSVAGGQACVAQSRRNTPPWPTGFTGPPPPPPAAVAIDCVASGDGADRWSRRYPTEGAERWFGMLDDGTFVQVRSEGTTHSITRVDAAGSETTRIERPGYALSAAIAATGDVAVGVYDRDTQRRRIVRYAAQGGERSIDIGVASAFEVVGITRDAVQAVVAGSTVREYRWFGADGQVAWSRATGGLLVQPAADRSSESVYLAERLSSLDPAAVRVVRLRASDGTVAWLGAPVFFGALDPLRDKTVLDVAYDRAVLARVTSSRVQVARIDARDGAVLDQRIVACGTYCGLPGATAIDAHDTVRVALSVVPAGGIAATTAVIAFSDASAQPAVRLDQVGLAGAWWAPYASGEGFVVDWLPDTRTWFMPWFTYSRDGGDGERAAQRWYAVAGTVAAGATQAELPILETTGGTFDAAGGATVRRVGTAMLRFTDCDNGTLRYAFDASANGGATGTITLSRLSSATRDCMLADGSVQTRAVPPAGGFDARMSGSWYEPATSGQGLQFEVRPGGVFFAPWFTFDSAGAADDPGRQRWYTVQGSLANATNGRVTLPIVETTGGAFDSRPATRTAIVGTATIVMLGCDRATLDYAFNATAADLAGRTGTLDLVKAGGCTP